MDAAGELDVLLLDFGGVCLLNPVELHGRTEGLLGLPPGTLDWLGPVDPSTDPLWRAMIDGELTERDYWERRAREVALISGRPLDVRAYMTMLYDPPTPEMVRPEAVAVVEDARRSGYGVSVLTNDMRAFHGPEWEHGVDFLRLVDHIVDCSDTGVLKPDPAAFARAEAAIGVPLGRMLFVDDQPKNVEGALGVGLEAMWFDIARADRSWTAVAARLGLGPEEVGPPLPRIPRIPRK